MLTKSIVAHLNVSGWKAWRQNNTAVYDKDKGYYRAFQGLRGVPDIIGFHRKTGIGCYVEVKAGKDRLGADQKQFIEIAESSGCLVIVARSFDQYLEEYKQFIESWKKDTCY